MDDTTGVDNRLFYRHGGGAGPSGDGAGYTAGFYIKFIKI